MVNRWEWLTMCSCLVISYTTPLVTSGAKDLRQKKNRGEKDCNIAEKCWDLIFTLPGSECSCKTKKSSEVSDSGRQRWRSPPDGVRARALGKNLRGGSGSPESARIDLV